MDVNKQRLMLSAAAGALLAFALAAEVAHADTDLTTAVTTAHNTTTDGNLTIESTGSISVTSTTPAVLLNSNAFVYNGGAISNNDTAGAIGLEIDTTAGDIKSLPLTSGTSGGFNNTGSIALTGSGTGKAGILVTGGHTFFGPVILQSVTTLVTTGGTIQPIVGGSSVAVQGDTSSAFYLVNGTTIDGDVSLGGTMAMAPSANSVGSSSLLVNLDGAINGNLIIGSTGSLTSIGNGVRGVQIGGGIHTCDTAAVTAAGATPCAATSVGAFVNQGTIQVIGSQFADPKKANPESGSALVIASSIDGGFLNNGPATSNSNSAAATISANGIAGAPTLLIDPSQALVTGTTTPRGPIVIGPVAATIDPIDPGYSLINRGTITAIPTDGGISSQAVYITGSSAAYFTCLGVSAGGNCTGGGLLNTGTISSRAGTTTVTPAAGSSAPSTYALTIGPYATVPRIDVAGETISGTTTTPGTISAQISGVGQGSAFGLYIAANGNVSTINVKQGGSIAASVATSTVSPSADIATTTAPFQLLSEAIVDNSGTGSLQAINNAGTISAANTLLTPAAGAIVTNQAIAINLLSSQASGVAHGITINNSGVIEGDVLFGSVSVGSADIFNVGNTGPGGNANVQTGLLNTPNLYAVVAATATSLGSGQAPATTANTISFGSVTGAIHQLNIGAYGYVNSVILADAGSLDINLYDHGTLFIANTATTGTVNTHDFNAYGGTLGLTISQQTGGSVPIVKASDAAIIGPNTTLGLQFGGFVSSGTTAASINNPTPQQIILVTAPIGSLNISDSTLANDNAVLASNIPYLFQASTTPLSKAVINSNDALVLTLTPKSPAQLGLTGDAAALFPRAAAALINDPQLGAQIAGGITNAQSAQQVFSQFAPDVSGGAKQVAIMLTDQATGPVAARQRLLRSYADQPGEMTLWGQEFAANINNKGRVDADGSLTNYKDHGFGFAVGVDAGSTRGGWYGGAFSFYTGDVTQTLPRDSKTNTEWYMLTGYTDWRGKHVFLDTQASLAYGNFNGHRDLIICPNGVATCLVPAYERETSSKRAGLLGAAGATTGVLLHWAGMEITPHLGLDMMSLREEGYTEAGGGDGMDLQVEPYYANSVRTALGADFKANLNVWGFDFSPEARLGYRYDFINMPVKLKAAFLSTGGTATTGNTFTFVGPDPDTGNLLAGLSLGGSTDSWQFGINYDWVRGNNASTSQIATITVLGRI
jgi:hypothetical protein